MQGLQGGRGRAGVVGWGGGVGVRGQGGLRSRERGSGARGAARQFRAHAPCACAGGAGARGAPPAGGQLPLPAPPLPVPPPTIRTLFYFTCLVFFALLNRCILPCGVSSCCSCKGSTLHFSTCLFSICDSEFPIATRKIQGKKEISIVAGGGRARGTETRPTSAQ